MDSEVHVDASKTKTVFLLVLAIGFMSLGYWLLSLDAGAIESRARYNNPTFIYGLGWAVAQERREFLAPSGW